MPADPRPTATRLRRPSTACSAGSCWPATAAPTPLFCDNETNAERLWGLPGRSPYPKDGINDHVVDGAATVNPDRVGTKAALHYVLDVPAGGQRQIRLRLARAAPPPAADAAAPGSTSATASTR